ncbi:hypothetical protein CR513_25475, partial [Mucuna pruriens]
MISSSPGHGRLENCPSILDQFQEMIRMQQCRGDRLEGIPHSINLSKIFSPCIEAKQAMVSVALPWLHFFLQHLKHHLSFLKVLNLYINSSKVAISLPINFVFIFSFHLLIDTLHPIKIVRRGAAVHPDMICECRHGNVPLLHKPHQVRHFLGLTQSHKQTHQIVESQRSGITQFIHFVKMTQSLVFH